jgi:hypothetical protein
VFSKIRNYWMLDEVGLAKVLAVVPTHYTHVGGGVVATAAKSGNSRRC